jgi:L-2-hydroxyglutarate oxidase LhgO
VGSSRAHRVRAFEANAAFADLGIAGAAAVRRASPPRLQESGRLTYDLAVIGAGLVGLASARETLRRHPRLRLAVLEKEPGVARHQSGHNSGVIHSGIYYQPGSLKARLCVAGAREMYSYCAQKGLPVERSGKLIVAADASELPRLEALQERGIRNGVEGLDLIGPDAMHEVEPHCAGVKALWSPNTGITDYSAVARSYADDVRELGGEIRCEHRVERIEERADMVVVHTPAGEVEARSLLACAGLHSDRVARLTRGSPLPKIVPFRGDYWMVRPERRHLVRNLIYPVPDPAFPFLGVHFTRRIVDGAVWLGPNAVLAFAREGYRRRDVKLRDLSESLAYRGFRRLAGRYWRMGAAEMWGDLSKRAFLRACRRYVPELTAEDLIPGPSGVRAQALGPDGQLVDDFVVESQGRRILHVRNAPSPAATSSLAIGRLVADSVEQLLSIPQGGRTNGIRD